jgi:hypothetical protein
MDDGDALARLKLVLRSGRPTAQFCRAAELFDPICEAVVASWDVSLLAA